MWLLSFKTNKNQQTNSFNLLSLLVTEYMYLWVIWKVELMLNKNAE